MSFWLIPCAAIFVFVFLLVIYRRRITVSSDELADNLAEIALRPFENPSDQDKSFREQAQNAGVYPDRFAFEAVALQCFATGSAINRERLEGRIPDETAELLANQFMAAVLKRTKAMENHIWEIMRIDAQSAFNLILAREEKYVRPAYGEGSIKDIYLMFADFCGVPGSSTLERIGWSLCQVRGDQLGATLSRMRIIPRPA